MLGSRADLIVDGTYLVTLSAPLMALMSIQLARARAHQVHRGIQIALLGVCLLAVAALEVRIRLAGGSGALLRHSPALWAGVARGFLAVHISAAVLTYGTWAYLALVSARRHHRTLPGRFSRRHKRLGWLIFAGLCFTAASASGMYFLAFVA
jgi:hypothetical protein